MLGNYNTWKVARVFFDEPKKQHSLRAISRKAKLAPKSVLNHLEILKRERVIAIEVETQGRRKLKRYVIDSYSAGYKTRKIIDILDRIQESNLIRHLTDAFSPTAIVLFGSASRGEDRETSDIDLFIQTSSKNEFDHTPFEKAFKRKIQLHIKRNIKDYPKELQNNIANGITLYGFIEVAR